MGRDERRARARARNFVCVRTLGSCQPRMHACPREVSVELFCFKTGFIRGVRIEATKRRSHRPREATLLK